MEFSDVLGQDNIKRALKDALSKNHIGHAYLFYGESGIGKSMMARIFARKILCGDYTEEGCSCSSCAMFLAGVHPDYYVVECEGSSIGVDKIRRMQTQVIMKPTYGRKKVFVIDDAHTMTVDAQNALLKTLEDPPEYVVILLCSNNYDMLLDTIKSRLVKYSFKKNSSDEMEEYLRRNNFESDDSKDFLVSYANGNIGKLISIMGNDEQRMLRDVVVNYALDVKKMDRLKTINAVNFFVDNKESSEYMLSVFMSVYRDILIIKETEDDTLLTNNDKRFIILAKQNDFTQDELIRDIETIEKTLEYIKKNANFGLSVEVMFSRMQEVS